jgi:phytoene dehydrogenase-like protein
MKYGTSLLSIFCAVERDLAGEGFDSGNYWWYRHDDVEGIYRKMETALPGGQVDGLFMTITTLKDPGHVSVGNHHTIEMFTFVPYAPFARWADTPQGARGTDYELLKESLGRQMLDAAEQIMPGIRKDLRFFCVGTPLTNDFYCATQQGSSYGTAKTPWQLGPLSFQVRCGVEHLYSCGQSTLSHGVGGASLSGLMAAKAVLGCKRVEDLLQPGGEPLRVYPADQPELWLPRRNMGVALGDTHARARQTQSQYT